MSYLEQISNLGSINKTKGLKELKSTLKKKIVGIRIHYLSKNSQYVSLRTMLAVHARWNLEKKDVCKIRTNETWWRLTNCFRAKWRRSWKLQDLLESGHVLQAMVLVREKDRANSWGSVVNEERVRCDSKPKQAVWFILLPR